MYWTKGTKLKKKHNSVSNKDNWVKINKGGNEVGILYIRKSECEVSVKKNHLEKMEGEN